MRKKKRKKKEESKKEEVNLELVTEAGTVLQKAYNKSDSRSIMKAISLLKSSLSQKSVSRLQRADRIKIQPNASFVDSGLKWFDNLLKKRPKDKKGGVRRQELVLIGGVPYSGKTHILTYFGAHYAKTGKTVFHFGGEDLIDDILENYSKILTKKQLQKIFIDDVMEYHFTVDYIDKAISEAVEEGIKPDIIIVDYVDVLIPSGGKQDWLAVSDIVRELRYIGKRQDAITITASQMGYGNEGGSGASRLYRGKVGKMMDPDVVFLIEGMDGHFYDILMAKARGRKIKEKELTWYVDLDRMIVEPDERGYR